MKTKKNQGKLYLWQILLPKVDNHGRSQESRLQQWEEECCRIAGGYTKFPTTDGAWIPEGATESQRDASVLYQVVCDAKTWDKLTAQAFALLYDQQALYTARLGAPKILKRVYRDEVPPASRKLARVLAFARE